MSPMPQPIISFEDVHFSYETESVLGGITLAVEQGEFFALLGPNGSGKTTLLKLALGLLRPDGGEVRLFDTAVAKFGAWERIGYVPQRAEGMDNRFPGTVAEIVAQGEHSGFQPLAFMKRSLTPAVVDALHTVGMWHARSELIGNLSRGQQQRVLVARALVRPRDLLVLDEPTSGIDQAGQQNFYSLLRDLNRERGMTVFLISHDVGVVLEQATHVACISHTVVFHGAAEHLTEDHLLQLYGTPVSLLAHRHE